MDWVGGGRDPPAHLIEGDDMGIDVHEWRRVNGKEDPNPAAKRAIEYSAYGVPASKSKRSRPQVGRGFQKRYQETAYKERHLK